MLFGLIVYIYGQKYLPHVGNKPTKEEKNQDRSFVKLFLNIVNFPIQLTILCVLLILSIYAGFTFEGVDHWGYGALFIFLSLTIGLLMMIGLSKCL